MKKFDLSAIMRKAWKLYRKGVAAFSECLHRAWNSAKAEPINAQRIEEAQQAAGVAEPVNTWAGWKAAGYMVEHVVSPPDAQKKKPALERVRLSSWFCFFTPLFYPQAFGLTALLVLRQIHLTQFCVGHSIARPHHAPKALVDFGFVGSVGNVQFSCEETARWQRSASRRSSDLRCRQSTPCHLP